jgi:aminoglycoside phosphotransferase (APT) family kinase protein
MTTRIQAVLSDYYTHYFPDNSYVRIDNVHRISDGWETDIYAFDLESGLTGEHTYQELILRIYPGADGEAESLREFNGMRLLHEAGYPVPQVHMQAGKNSPVDFPFVIMDRINGQLMWQLMNDAPIEKKEKLLTRFCELFVNLHQLDWLPFSQLAVQAKNPDPYQYIDCWINTTHRDIQLHYLQGFSEALDWFAEQREQLPCTQPSIVHLDFHPNNVLLCDDGQAFVIDWSQIQLSDARFDLAWTLVLANAYMGDQWRDQILANYDTLNRKKVEMVEVFEAFACTRRLFYVTASLIHGAENFGMRPDAVESMREQMDPLSKVYNQLKAITSVKIPEVECLLE